MQVLPTLRGAFCLVFMDESTLYAARDPHGVRPLVLGRSANGWVVASETAALDIVGASFVREVEPGELLAIDEHGVRSGRFADATPKGCLFEYVYLARPDTWIAGQSVYTTRVQVGRTLAFEAPVDADLVIPVPESGTPGAIGFAEQSGIPYGMGLVKNAYVGRTFIQPSQTIRQLGIRLKLNPLRDVVRGKRLVVVDDSIVRGNTQRALVRMLREAGALEVHVRISSPPVMWPCFYGIDFASRAELIASGLGVEQIRASIGADSLAFVSLSGLTAASAQPADRLCRACFDGQYPIPVPQRDLIGKHVLEGLARGAEGDAADDRSVPGTQLHAHVPTGTDRARLDEPVVGEREDRLRLARPEGSRPLDGGDEAADLLRRVRDAGAVHDLRDGHLADRAVRRVLAVQQGVDHRVLEVRPPPPGDEGVRVALPAFGREEGGRDLAEAALHVHDRAVLVEHADGNAALDLFGIGHVGCILEHADRGWACGAAVSNRPCPARSEAGRHRPPPAAPGRPRCGRGCGRARPAIRRRPTRKGR